MFKSFFSTLQGFLKSFGALCLGLSRAWDFSVLSAVFEVLSCFL